MARGCTRWRISTSLRTNIETDYCKRCDEFTRNVTCHVPYANVTRDLN